MRVSLILATIGRTEELGTCLRSLAVQTDKNFEVLLIDQNPDERLQPFVREAIGLGVTLTHLRMAYPSLSGARNLGLDHACGNIVGLTDDDCWYEPDTIENIRAIFRADPKLDGIVGQWVEQAQARTTTPETGALSLNAWRRFRGGDASSITIFFSRAIFTRLNGFDERFGIGQWFGAGEETDFVLRALASSANIMHHAQVRVHHHFGNNSLVCGGMQRDNFRRRARGTGGIYAKHRLSAWTITRGLITPILQPIVHGNFHAALLGCYIVFGRLEGYVYWKFKGLR